MANETKTLAAYAASLQADDIPPAVFARAARLVLDSLGSAIYAQAEAPWMPAVTKTLIALGHGGQSRVIVPGSSASWPPAAAALLTGAGCHALDFDDTHAPSSVHPTAPVFAAALSAAAIRNASGRDLLCAVVLGHEIACRLGMALTSQGHYARGFHPTATAGCFGAAAAAGKLLGLDAAGFESAFGMAGSQAAGSMQFLADGAPNKPVQVGLAAMHGLTAALLAENGFKAASGAIEGENGVLKGYTDTPRPDLLTQGLGDGFETMRISVKSYPSCRYTHAPLDGIIALRNAHRLHADQVSRIVVNLHPTGVALTGYPEPVRRRPKSAAEAQFSMYFTAASAFMSGAFGLDNFSRLDQTDILALADRVDVEEETALEAQSGHPFGAIVRVETDGGTYMARIDEPSGEPAHFSDDTQIVSKFISLARFSDPEDARIAANAVLGLDNSIEAIPVLRALVPSS